GDAACFRAGRQHARSDRDAARPRLPAAPAMNFRPSLRRQISWLLTGVALLVAVAQAAFVYWSAERWEEQLIDAVATEQLRLSIAQYGRDPALAAPNTPD